ncbi:MAG: hypothetical protein AB7U20_06915 [Planctomycetaceae bacterium]
MTDVKLTKSQIEILTALKGTTPDKPLTRSEVKTGCGITGKYSSGWLNGLWELYGGGLILIEEDESGKTYHSITAAGKKALSQSAKAEKGSAS